MPLDFAITALVTLLVVVDPIGLAPTFLAVTEGLPRRARRDVAVRASLIAGAILIGTALSLSCLAAFLLAGRLSRMLGHTGNIVLSRLLGVLLAALAVQYVVDGIRAVLAG